MKNTDMLLFTTNIDIAYECSLYAGTWHIRSVHMLLHTLHMGTPFVHYNLVYKQHLYAMPIFVVYNNISAFFVHKIESFPIQLAIFDIFRSHFP